MACSSCKQPTTEDSNSNEEGMIPEDAYTDVNKKGTHVIVKWFDGTRHLVNLKNVHINNWNATWKNKNGLSKKWIGKLLPWSYAPAIGETDQTANSGLTQTMHMSIADHSLPSNTQTPNDDGNNPSSLTQGMNALSLELQRRTPIPSQPDTASCSACRQKPGLRKDGKFFMHKINGTKCIGSSLLTACDPGQL